MANYESNFDGDFLSRKHDILFIYKGPSFEDKMEISSLTSQLHSTEFVLKEIVDALYTEKNITERETKFYLRVKQGSFEEIIEIILNHPMSVAIVGGCIVAIFNRLLERRENRQCNVTIVNNFVTNIDFVRHIEDIVLPLEKNEDILTIRTPSNPEIMTQIPFMEKERLKNAVKKLQEEEKIEITEEEFNGYLYLINIDASKFGFTFEQTSKHIPATFEIQPSREELRRIVFEELKVKARAFYRNSKLEHIEILEYQIKEKRKLF